MGIHEHLMSALFSPTFLLLCFFFYFLFYPLCLHGIFMEFAALFLTHLLDDGVWCISWLASYWLLGVSCGFCIDSLLLPHNMNVSYDIRILLIAFSIHQSLILYTILIF